MTEIKHLMPKPLTIGDAAVDGLLSGVLAGGVMAVFLAVAGLLSGESPLNLLGRFDPSAQSEPLTGALTHLAVSGVYGALFGIIWRLIARRVRQRATVMLAGSIYGLALLVVATTVILPGGRSPLLEIATGQLAIAHLLYGMTLGWLVYRVASNSK